MDGLFSSLSLSLCLSCARLWKNNESKNLYNARRR